jgi:hypothetical protein
MKTIFGDQMRSRSFENQKTDLLIRCYAMNKINMLGLPVSEVIYYEKHWIPRTRRGTTWVVVKSATTPDKPRDDALLSGKTA